jgi:hypothetical protein
MQRCRKAVDDTALSPRTLANIRMKQLNVLPLLMLLIVVLFIVYWLRPH